MEKRWDILGLGAVAVDDILYLERFPRPDEKMPVQATRRQGGGLTATALVAAARHGARSAYCARLGDDDLSQYSLGELEREGVDVATVQRTPRARPYHSVILVDAPSASRVILYNTAGVEEPDDEFVSEEMVAAARFLFIDHTAPRTGMRAARFARAQGIPVAADIESIDLPDLPGFLALVDHLIVGIAVAAALTGRAEAAAAVRALSGAERAACVVTDGVNGCWYSQRGGPVSHLPAYRVDTVDTTGCGDVFHGCYTAALARGETVRRAVQIASASAALKATCCGGREGIPGLERVEALIRDRAEIHEEELA